MLMPYGMLCFCICFVWYVASDFLCLSRFAGFSCFRPPGHLNATWRYHFVGVVVAMTGASLFFSLRGLLCN